MPGTPAAQAGARARDVIVAVDGQPIVDETTLGRALNKHQPGGRVTVGLQNDRFAEIPGGLQEGELVATSGLRDVADGQSVIVQTSDNTLALTR